MTTQDTLAELSDIVADLSRELPPRARFQRLLEALMNSFPCDATALLQLEEERLVPRAVKGLSQETMGRSFEISEHPRLQEILLSRGGVRFPADSNLPDPYDGFVDTPDHHLYVHDCMGAPLHVDGRTWGVLTLDAMEAGSFDDLDMKLLESFISVTAATIRAAELISSLESNLQRHQLVHDSWITEQREAKLIGDSEVMQHLQREADMVGRSDLAVLIEGETGTGKELVARFIHAHSPRSQQPMIQVNCAALPESLAESELFGHVSGSFSGAHKDRTGKFELAHGGTLFLDEVGELPRSIQAKLLRTLQSGEIQRVGSDRAHHVDVRIIAATNRNLAKEVKEKRFRADLYHRLSVYPIKVPALRDRGNDISLLTGHFLQHCERKFGLRALRLNPEARSWIMSYPWPGNVRELEHAISRATVRALSEGKPHDKIIELTPFNLGEVPVVTRASIEDSVLAATLPAELSMSEAVGRFKRELISRRLAQYDHNLTATARSLGLDKGNFHRQLKKLGLKE